MRRREVRESIPMYREVPQKTALWREVLGANVNI